MEPIRTITCKGGYRVELSYDEYPESPRDWDNLGTIYSNCRDYKFDGHGLEELIEEVGGDVYGSVIPWGLIAKKYFYRKVWMYDHSGVRFATGESNPWGSGWTAWDSGLAGVIVCDRKKAIELFGDVDDLQEKAEALLDDEIKTLDKWASGDVYTIRVYDTDDNLIDCLGGFYDEDEAIEEGKDSAEYDYVSKNGEELFNE